jgi:FAD/FMN-containing dehydrogenase
MEIALMKRIKAAFDPNGILNPGKIFPADPPHVTVE